MRGFLSVLLFFLALSFSSYAVDIAYDDTGAFLEKSEENINSTNSLLEEFDNTLSLRGSEDSEYFRKAGILLSRAGALLHYEFFLADLEKDVMGTLDVLRTNKAVQGRVDFLFTLRKLGDQLFEDTERFDKILNKYIREVKNGGTNFKLNYEFMRMLLEEFIRLSFDEWGVAYSGNISIGGITALRAVYSLDTVMEEKNYKLYNNLLNYRLRGLFELTKKYPPHHIPRAVEKNVNYLLSVHLPSGPNERFFIQNRNALRAAYQELATYVW